MKLAALLLLLLPSLALAQLPDAPKPKPDAQTTLVAKPSFVSYGEKSWYKQKKFWAGTAVICACMAADAYTTVNRRRGLVESNGLLGPNPDTGSVVAVSAAGFAVEFTLHALSYHVVSHDPSRVWRDIGHWWSPVAATAIPCRSAIQNIRLSSHP
jgi:hypothetical protein